MKYTLFALTLIAKISTAQVLTFEQTQDVNLTNKYSNGDLIEKYIMKDGSEITVGSPIKFGTPLAGKTFQYCYYGEYNLAKGLLGTPTPLQVGYSGEEVVVTAVKVSHTKMSKNSPLSVWLYVENPKLGGAINNRTIFDLEKAIELKEVMNPNAAMTRDEAIAKLKEAKDLLDLGMMSQADYDAMKENLTPIIMKKD